MLKKFKKSIRDKLNFLIKEKERNYFNKILDQGKSIENISEDRKINFHELNNKYLPKDNYKYDRFSTWERGFYRAKDILKAAPKAKENVLDFFELCCGDGMAGKILADYGHTVFQHDLKDWRDARAKKLDFVEKDLIDHLIINKKFDVIFSFNSFEHIPDPEQTLFDLIKHLKPSGVIYLEFGPLYNSPWGLHAHKTFPIPYIHFLFDEEFIQDKVKGHGVDDLGQRLPELQPVNKWSLRKFEELWEKSGLEIISKDYGKDYSHLGIIKIYPYAFQGKGLDFEEVTTQWIRIVLKKKSSKK